MNKISLLHTRKRKITEAGKSIRKEIDELIDKDSFVELSAFSFSNSEFYDEGVHGEGVVTGFATVGGYSFCVVAQNAAVLSGGVSKANCDKIVKCLNQAEKTSTPVIYLLSSLGVQIGEGVNVLEGLASLILKVSQLKGTVPQYLVVNGKVYGQTALLAALCDFCFFIDKKSVLAVNSPLVISAHSGRNISESEVGGANGLDKAGLTSFVAESLSGIREKVIAISDLLSTPVTDCDDLNLSLPELDKKADAKDIMSVFDKDSAVELGSAYSPEVKCVLGRIGGIAVACIVFDKDGGVELNAYNVRKIRDFAEFACCYDLPYINFVDTLGFEADLEVSNSPVLKETGEYVSILDCITAAKISVVFGKAIGAGYTLFAAKSMGYDFTYAFANARISLFDSVQGAEIEFSDEKADKNELIVRYGEENSDPINAAHGGYIDSIIQPAFVRQYLIASLQTLLK